MNEERDLLIRAGRRIRNARQGQLLAGVAIIVTGVVLVALFHPAVTGRDEGGLLTWLWISALFSAVFAIGGALIAASLGRFRDPDRGGFGHVVVTAIPFLGGLVSWLARRHDNELVNPEAVVEPSDNPFVRHKN